MRRWRSSSFYTWERTGCGATLCLERDGVPEDLQIYAVGQVAHLLLEAATRWQADDPLLIGDAMTRRLHALSWTFLDRMPAWEGESQPPVGPEQAAEGLRLVLGWIERFGVPQGQPEVGLAVGQDLRTPVPYDSPDARWRGLVDSVSSYDDFDDESFEEFSVLKVADFKTSWADQRALTLQRKGQAILAVAHRDEMPGRLILQTVSLPRHQTFEYVSEDPAGDLDEWRGELATILERADAAVEHHSPASAARPGPSCTTCPYLAHCEAGLAFAGTRGYPEGFNAAEDVAAANIAAWGASGALEKMLFAGLCSLVDRQGGTVKANGFTVERGTKTVRKVKPCLPEDLWRRWFSGTGDPEAAALGLLARLGLGVQNVESLIKSRDPIERKPWRKWLASRVERSQQPHGLKVLTEGVHDDHG